MRSLPTLLSTAQVDSLLSTIETLSSARVIRHSDIVTVEATRKATGETVTVMRAASSDGAHWHVMAVPGLIRQSFAVKGH